MAALRLRGRTVTCEAGSAFPLGRPQGAGVGTSFTILLLGHGEIVNDDKFFSTVFADRAGCVNHPEHSGSRNIGFLFAVWAGEHGLRF